MMDWCLGGSSMMLLGLLFWILVIVVVVIFVKWLWEKESLGRKDALEILKKRYARGDISKEEYEEMKTELV